MAPEIYPYLKIEIDKHRERAKGASLFLLTGSANLLTLHQLAEALVGRMSVISLYPFSAGEYTGRGGNFIHRLFESKPVYRSYKPYKIIEYIKDATFPEPALNKEINREQWYGDYLNTLIQRDVQTVADIRDPSRMIMLFSMMAMRAGGLVNNNQIAQETGLEIKTYNRYKTAAINTFLFFELPAWTKPTRLNKRFTKTPKLYFTDTNLLAYLLKRDLNDIFNTDSVTMGRLFENFVACEILKNASSIIGLEVSHFRTSDQKEVDFVLEKGKEVIGIEVKLGSTLGTKDFSGLRVLKEAVGKRFTRGIVLYTGTDMLPFGEDLWAVPVSYLWED